MGNLETHAQEERAAVVAYLVEHRNSDREMENSNPGTALYWTKMMHDSSNLDSATLSIMTLSIITFSIMTLSIMTPCIMTLNIMPLGIMAISMILNKT